MGSRDISYFLVQGVLDRSLCFLPGPLPLIYPHLDPLEQPVVSEQQEVCNL
jgi:hypothetical protein